MLGARRVCAWDEALYDSYESLILAFLETATGVRLAFSGDAKEALATKESVLFISNHQSSSRPPSRPLWLAVMGRGIEVDWAVVNMLAVRQGTLGSVRYVLKSDLQYIPLYGWSGKAYSGWCRGT